MAYRPYGSNGTIAETLQAINERKLVLPAIQREFVWDDDQICNFFDSLMQGFPFGTFLYWDVDPKISSKFKWYGLITDYHQKDNPHCPVLPVMHNKALTAILDGQQRLTAMNIGLQGSIARKLPYGRWNNPNAFPRSYLHIDLLANINQADGTRYRFEFLRPGQGSHSQGTCWFRVAAILKVAYGADLFDELIGRGLSEEQLKQANRTLFRLFQVIHTDPVVFCYEEKSQNIENVLQIFIRLNSGGTYLSYSDLLLSIATAQWDSLDAREEIHGLVDTLNSIGRGFNFSKDFVLKAGLMLCDVNVGFRVSNFNKPNMDKMEERWDTIRQTLMLTVQLADRFGFNRDNLRATNALLPIAYYLNKSGCSDSFITHSSYETDRKAIQSWLIRSLMKQGIWGSGLDSLLTALRQAVNSNGQSIDFPNGSLEHAMARRGKSLVFTDEEIEFLADMWASDRRVFPLLSLLFPFTDLANHFHIDHIFPVAQFTHKNLINAGVPSEKFALYFEMRDSFANLQLLEGRKNTEKQAMLPKDWLTKAYPDVTARQAYADNHLLGDLPDDLAGFEAFYEARRERLEDRIRNLLALH